MNSHPFNPWSFLAGILFVLTAAGWLAISTNFMTRDTIAMTAPAVLIVTGIAGLALTFRRS